MAPPSCRAGLVWLAGAGGRLLLGLDGRGPGAGWLGLASWGPGQAAAAGRPMGADGLALAGAWLLPEVRWRLMGLAGWPLAGADGGPMGRGWGSLAGGRLLMPEVPWGAHGARRRGMGCGWVAAA